MMIHVYSYNNTLEYLSYINSSEIELMASDPLNIIFYDIFTDATVIYCMYVFHVIWEFIRSADHVTQSEYFQFGSQSADCYAIYR